MTVDVNFILLVSVWRVYSSLNTPVVLQFIVAYALRIKLSNLHFCFFLFSTSSMRLGMVVRCCIFSFQFLSLQRLQISIISISFYSSTLSIDSEHSSGLHTKLLYCYDQMEIVLVQNQTKELFVLARHYCSKPC